MDIQNTNANPVDSNVGRPGIFFSKKSKNPEVVYLCEDDHLSQNNHQNMSITEKQPPNFDFLGEFTYEKAASEQPKIDVLAKDNSILKDHLSKIFEKVSIKKKKEKKSN